MRSDVVMKTLYLYNNVEGLDAKVDMGNLLQGPWQTELTHFNIGTKLADLATKGYDVDGNPAYDVFKRFTDAVTVPECLFFCPPTAGQFLSLIVPGVGYNYRLKDGSLTVDHPDFTNLFKHIQLCYKIEGDLGHNLESGKLSWTDWNTNQPAKSTDSAAIAAAPSNETVTGWITEIYNSVANLTSMFIDDYEGKFYRYNVWGLLRWHLHKASHLRAGKSGPGYPMYAWNDDAFAPIHIATLFSTDKTVIYWGTTKDGVYQSGPTFNDAPDELRLSIKEANGYSNTNERWFNWYNAGPYGGIYGGPFPGPEPPATTYNKDVYSFAYLWGNAEFPVIASMSKNIAVSIPLETVAFHEYVKGLKVSVPY
jgi:hypothetical protein